MVAPMSPPIGDGNPEGLEWIELADFSPGIYSDHFGADHSRMIDGAATMANTYGCYADASGALNPLPARRVPTLKYAASDAWDDDWANSDNAEPYMTYGYIGLAPYGSMAKGHTRRSANPLLARAEHHAVNWLYDGTWGGGRRSASSSGHAPVWVVGFFYDDPAIPPEAGVRKLHGVNVFQGWVKPLALRDADVLGTSFVGECQRRGGAILKPASPLAFIRSTPRGAMIEWTRTSFDEPPTDQPAERTVDFLAFGLRAGPGEIESGAIRWMNDDDGDPAALELAEMLGLDYWPEAYSDGVTRWASGVLVWARGGSPPTLPYVGGPDEEWGWIRYPPMADCHLLVAHQARLVSVVQSNDSDLAEEFIAYSDALALHTGNYHTLLVGEEAPSGIGVLASLTADELFVVKHTGGGVLVRGDLDNPQVVKLPFIQSTGGLVSRGTPSPLGFAYGTSAGVFVFTGGAQTEKLSNQIDGCLWDFWTKSAEEHPSAVNWIGSRGRFGFWHPFICVPNNWIMHTESGGWWRLENPDETFDPRDHPYPVMWEVTHKDNDKFSFVNPSTEYTRDLHATMGELGELEGIPNAAWYTTFSTDTADVGAHYIPNDRYEHPRDFDHVIYVATTQTFRFFFRGDGQFASAGMMDNGYMVEWVPDDPTDATTAGVVRICSIESGTPTVLASFTNPWFDAGYFRIRVDDAGVKIMRWAPADLALYRNPDPFEPNPPVWTWVYDGPIGDGGGKLWGYGFASLGVGSATTLGGGPVWWDRTVDQALVPAYNAYEMEPETGSLLAFHHKVTNHWPYPLHQYQWDELRSYYTWQSQPLIRTRRDNILFRQLELVATAHADATDSTVTITLTGHDRDGNPYSPASATFNLEENGRVSYRIADIRNFQARYVQVRIESESATGPAPKVHAIRLATVPGNPIPKG